MLAHFLPQRKCSALKSEFVCSLLVIVRRFGKIRETLPSFTFIIMERIKLGNNAFG